MAEEKVVNQGVEPGDPPAPNADASLVPPVVEGEKPVAYERFKEVNDRSKFLEEQVQVLLKIAEQKTQPAPPIQEEDDSMLDPIVKKIKQENQLLKNAVGAMADQVDQIRVEANPNYKDYGKYKDKVEMARRQYAQQGQFIPREQIFLFLKGQEALKAKSEPEKPAQETPSSQPIPQTQTAQANIKSTGKPKTLAEEKEALANVEF